MGRNFRLFLSLFISIFGCTSLHLATGSDATASGESAEYSESLHDLRSELLKDFRQLDSFTSKIRSYKITEEDYYGLFYSGIRQSLAFYLDTDWSQVQPLSDLSNQLDQGNLQFSLSETDGIEVDQRVAEQVLNQFAGQWHGRWEAMEVHHNWLQVKESNVPIFDGYTLTGYQSCFTGDGVGWNYVVRKKQKTIILGFVYHYDGQGNRKSQNPHVARVNDQLQLTWVSDSHIYHEFVCNDRERSGQKNYVITGSAIEEMAKPAGHVSGFQAVYLSENKDLPVFRTFEYDLVPAVRHYLSKVLGEDLKTNTPLKEGANIMLLLYSS